MGKVEIKSKRLIFNDFFKIQEAILRYLRFDGKMSEPVRRLVFERGDAVAAIILNRDTQKVVLINQFRHGSNVLDTFVLVLRIHCQVGLALFEPCLRFPTYEKGPGWIHEVVAGIYKTE